LFYKSLTSSYNLGKISAVRVKTIKFIALKLRNKNCTLSVSYVFFYLNPTF